ASSSPLMAASPRICRSADNRGRAGRSFARLPAVPGRRAETSAIIIFESGRISSARLLFRRPARRLLAASSRQRPAAWHLTLLMLPTLQPAAPQPPAGAAVRSPGPTRRAAFSVPLFPCLYFAPRCARPPDFAGPSRHRAGDLPPCPHLVH